MREIINVLRVVVGGQCIRSYKPVKANHKKIAGGKIRRSFALAWASALARIAVTLISLEELADDLPREDPRPSSISKTVAF